MIGTQQYLQPQQTATIGTSQISELLTSIMPLIMMMMVMTKIATHPSLRAPTGGSASDGEAP
jgi:hypothetical protein